MLINLTYEDGIKISELKTWRLIFPKKEFSFLSFQTKLIVIRPFLTASIKVKQHKSFMKGNLVL